MWYQVKAYLKFLLRSTNQHGVHSPFVYNLVTKCFYDTFSYKDYTKLKDYRKALYNNHKQIEITDLGAGSLFMKNKKRRISTIAKRSGTTSKNVKLLYRLTKYFNSNSILELGTSLGIGTQAMSLGNPNTIITTIEGCPSISDFTQNTFDKEGMKNIKLINGDFSEVINSLEIKELDLIFFDGNHQKESTLNYFEALMPKTKNDTIFIFDDIYWSRSMTDAWKAIKAHPKVTVTIDTFFWGFVFFRQEQKKEHFTIRV